MPQFMRIGVLITKTPSSIKICCWGSYHNKLAMGHFFGHPVVKSRSQNPHGKGSKNLTSDKKDLTCPPCARLPAPSQAPSLPQLPPNVTWWRVEGWKRGVSTGSCCCCTQWRLLATALVALVAQSGVAPTKFSQQRHQAAALSLRRPSSTENQIRHPMSCFPSKVTFTWHHSPLLCIWHCHVIDVLRNGWGPSYQILDKVSLMYECWVFKSRHFFASKPPISHFTISTIYIYIYI